MYIHLIQGNVLNTSPLKDGKAAGQTVPHVHFHLLPRKFTGDRFSDKNDEVYPALENSEESMSSALKTPHKRHETLKVDADEDRQPRSLEEMENEAIWLRGFFDSESEDT